MEAALRDATGVDRDDIGAVGQVSNLPAKVKQAGTSREPGSLFVQGVDEGYSDSVGYGFGATAKGYGSAREVWEALQTEDVVVISSDLAPERNASTFGPAVEPPVKLTGFYADDEKLPDDLYLRVEDPDSGKAKELRVIGVLESSASFAGQVVTSQKTLEGLAGGPVPPQAYYFDLRRGADAAATADVVEKDFADNGLQTEVTAEVIRDTDATRRIVFLLLRGFMGLRSSCGHLCFGRDRGALGGREAPADRDDAGPGLPEDPGTAHVPDRVLLHSPARVGRWSDPGDRLLGHADRQHPRGLPRHGVPGAVERPAAGRRGRLRRLAPDHLPASPTGLTSLPGGGAAL